MDKKHNSVSEISENATAVGSDFSDPKNYYTITDDKYNNNSGDSSNIEYSNIKPSDQQIDYHGPNSSNTRLRQIINNLNHIRIQQGFDSNYYVQNGNINIRTKTHETNKKTSYEVSGIHKDLLINMSMLKIPTLILKHALPIIMRGKDIVACTHTDSAITAAFGISIMNCILNNPSEINAEIRGCNPLAVIVVPTEKAVELVYNFISRLSKRTSIICRPLYGIESAHGKKHKIKLGVHIIVATPESLASYLGGNLVTFTALKYLVFDEVDLSFSRGFKPEIEFILNHKTMVSKDKRSTALFSMAMINDVKQLAKTYLKSNYVSVFTVPISS